MIRISTFIDVIHAQQTKKTICFVLKKNIEFAMNANVNVTTKIENEICLYNDLILYLHILTKTQRIIFRSTFLIEIRYDFFLTQHH